MLKYFMNCIYCNNKKLYTLKTGQLKCSACKKKFSPNKVHKELAIINCFCEDKSANHAAKELNMNYVTLKKRYEFFRSLIANYLEEQYENKDVIEYDEYIYLPQSKKKVKENIFDAQNFLTFSYDDKVFNLLMPDLSMYKTEYVDASVQDAYFKEFSKFMMMNKISKTKKRENRITRFWLYFEDSILKYKGVRDENFFYYLKEIEFKFNYDTNKQKRIITKLSHQSLI